MLRRRLMQSGIPKGAVDLGLPSGLLWAQGNIVKNGNTYKIGVPTDNGCYFSWGNVDGHNQGEGHIFGSSEYDYTPGHEVSTDIAANDAIHNAAFACLGKGWHVPSKEDSTELFEYCDIIDVNGNVLHAAGYNSRSISGDMRTTYNGVKGLLLRSTINGNLLFFPCAGYASYSSVTGVGERGDYWLSSYSTNYYGYGMGFHSSGAYSQNSGTGNNRYDGCPVRAVSVINMPSTPFIVNLFVEIYPETDDVTSFIPNTDFEVMCVYNNTFKTLYKFKAGTSYPIINKDGSYYILSSPDEKVVEIEYGGSTMATFAVVFPNGYDGQEVIGTFNDGTEYITQDDSSLYTSEINGQNFICSYDGTYSNRDDVYMSI